VLCELLLRGNTECCVSILYVPVVSLIGCVRLGRHCVVRGLVIPCIFVELNCKGWEVLLP
jgi:hypothetical protein